MISRLRSSLWRPGEQCGARGRGFLDQRNGRSRHWRVELSPVDRVGIGDYYVAMGDGITIGFGDDRPNDDNSADGRSGLLGFTGILADALTAARGYPVTVVNEGVSGAATSNGAAIIDTIPDQASRSTIRDDDVRSQRFQGRRAEWARPAAGQSRIRRQLQTADADHDQRDPGQGKDSASGQGSTPTAPWQRRGPGYPAVQIW